MAYHLGAGKIDRQGHAHAPGTKRIRNAGKLEDHLRVKRVQVGVDVVDGGAIEANRGQQPAILRNPCKVSPDVTVVIENAASGIAAFDAAIEVVPLVDPANRRRRSLGGRREGLLLRDPLQQVENPVEFPPVRAPSQHQVVVALLGDPGERPPFRGNRSIPGGQ